jgi:hypothetical protein
MLRRVELRFRRKKGGLRPGDWAEVRSAKEILASLDDRGCLDALPFMPEMLQFCGQRFRVFKTAHKTCDTIKAYKGRRMLNAVHLDGLRCDGKAHGGCQAECLIFWKEAWLKPAMGPASTNDPVEAPSGMCHAAGSGGSGCDVEALYRATRPPVIEGKKPDERYACQATELLLATKPLRWWDPRQYMMDLVSGNVSLRDFIRYVAIAAFNVVMRLHWRARLYPQYPSIRGLAREKTPISVLNLRPGELVQVRPKDEIMRTINAGQKNRGLWFDVEMLPYCGGTFRVLRRVERIINDKTGTMINLPNDCLILDGVTCSGYRSRDRLFCPRSIYPYWREIWLKRVE